MNMVAVQDPTAHGKLRKPFANSFSTKSLRGQEALVQEYIDLLVKQVGIKENIEKENDVVKWYNWCTFDIIGDLAFGEPFGCLREAKSHFWVDTVFEALSAGVWVNVLTRHFGFHPFFIWLRKWIIPKKLMEKRLEHAAFSRKKIVEYG